MKFELKPNLHGITKTEWNNISSRVLFYGVNRVNRHFLVCREMEECGFCVHGMQ